MTSTDVSSPDIDELLKLLGNRDRMQIMQALWEQFNFEEYVIDRPTPLPFSAIFEATDSTDSGNFNYHLGQLSGTLIEHREDGYVLTPLGYNLMRSIDSYSSFNYRTIEEQPIETPCPFCGASLLASYERELLRVRCSECSGIGSDGNINFVQIAATMATDLDLPQLLDVAARELSNRVTYSRDRSCPDCHTTLDLTASLCLEDEHDDPGLCETCSGRFRGEIRVNCSACGFSGVGPLAELALIDPEVGYRYRRAVDGDEPGRWRQRMDLLALLSESIEGDGPYRCTYTFDFADPIEIVYSVTEDGQFTHS